MKEAADIMGGGIPEFSSDQYYNAGRAEDEAKNRVFRFSKSGNPNIEKLFAAHYIGEREKRDEP